MTPPMPEGTGFSCRSRVMQDQPGPEYMDTYITHDGMTRQAAIAMHAPVVRAHAQVLDVRPLASIAARLSWKARVRRVRWDIVLRVLAGLLLLGVAGLAVWGLVLLVIAVVNLVMAVAAAVAAAVVWVQAHMGLLIVAAVVIFLCLGSGAAKCAGMHCGGCRR